MKAKIRVMIIMCGITGYLNFDGTRESGEKITRMIRTLMDRENGLGAGFVGYGLFPDYSDFYCFQIMYNLPEAKELTEEYLKLKGEIVKNEEVPVNPNALPYNAPDIHRYFFKPKITSKEVEEESVIQIVMHVNANINGAYFFSSGKNMAVFKGMGWSSEIADFYKIENYKAYMWIAHSRFPTNTGGTFFSAHPFSILDWSVVHNGEITSYGTNKRFLEMYGYKCTLRTDTEVLAYLFDMLVRRHNIPVPIAAIAFNPPLYEKIALMEKKYQMAIKNIRIAYRSAMVNGPFSIIVGRQFPNPTIISLTDRKKLRPQVIALSEDENTIYISSEEASIKSLVLDPNFNADYHKVWMPKAGSPVMAEMGKGIIKYGKEDPFEGYELKISEN